MTQPEHANADLSDVPADDEIAKYAAAIDASCMRVFGVSARQLDEIAGEAEREADEAHVRAGRLSPLAAPMSTNRSASR